MLPPVYAETSISKPTARRPASSGTTLLVVLLVVAGLSGGFGGVAAMLEATGPRVFGLEAAAGLRDFSHRMAQAVRARSIARPTMDQAAQARSHRAWGDESLVAPRVRSDESRCGVHGLTHLLDLPPPTA